MKTDSTSLGCPPEADFRRAGRPRGAGQRGQTRERALAAGERLLVEAGAAAVSMAAVADALGIRKASLYFHFPAGKEEMLLAVIARRTAEDGAVISSAIASASSAREQLLAIAEGFATRPGRLRGNVKDVARFLSEQSAEDAARHFLARVYAPIQQVIAAGVSSGEFRAHDAGKSAWVFLGLLSLLSPDAASPRGEDSSLIAPADVIDLLVDGMSARG